MSLRVILQTRRLPFAPKIVQLVWRTLWKSTTPTPPIRIVGPIRDNPSCGRHRSAKRDNNNGMVAPGFAHGPNDLHRPLSAQALQASRCMTGGELMKWTSRHSRRPQRRKVCQCERDTLENGLIMRGLNGCRASMTRQTSAYLRTATRCSTSIASYGMVFAVTAHTPACA